MEELSGHNRERQDACSCPKSCARTTLQMPGQLNTNDTQTLVETARSANEAATRIMITPSSAMFDCKPGKDRTGKGFLRGGMLKMFYISALVEETGSLRS
jgi:hypothetical protein